MCFTKTEEFLWVLSHCCPGFSGPPLDAGALTVDLEAACQALDQLMSISWIKNSVKTPHIILFMWYYYHVSFIVRLVSFIAGETSLPA